MHPRLQQLRTGPSVDLAFGLVERGRDLGADRRRCRVGTIRGRREGVTHVLVDERQLRQASEKLPDRLQRRSGEVGKPLASIDRAVDHVEEELHQRGAVLRNPVRHARNFITERLSEGTLDAVHCNLYVALGRLDLCRGVVAHRGQRAISSARSALDPAKLLGSRGQVQRLQSTRHVFRLRAEQCNGKLRPRRRILHAPQPVKDLL